MRSLPRRLIGVAVALLLAAGLMLPAIALPASASPKASTRTITVDSCTAAGAGGISFVEWSGTTTGSIVLEYQGPPVTGGRGHEKRLTVKSDIVVASPTTSEGLVEVVTPDGVGAGWVLTKAYAYVSSYGHGKNFKQTVGIPCDDGEACPAAPETSGGTQATRVDNDPWWTWTASNGDWYNWDVYACGDITFTYQWGLQGASYGQIDPIDGVTPTGSPVDILKSFNNCNIRVLVTATNTFGSTVAVGSDEAGCG